MEAVGEVQSANLELKISCNKILELGVENLHNESEEYQIIDLGQCLNCVKARSSLGNVCFENFPNIFVITLQVSCLDNEELDKFLNFLFKKIPKNREFVFQINFKESSEWQVYHKAKNAEKLLKLDLRGNEGLFLSRFKLIKKLEVKNFFEILKFLNCSLVDVDFNQILNFLSLSSADDKFLLMKNAIKAKDELLVKLLMPFVNELSENLLDEALNVRNVDILILVLNNFTANNVSEEQVCKILNHEQSDDLLLKIASQNHFKILQMLLRNHQFFNQSLNYKTWCMAKNKTFDKNFHKFNNLLQTFESSFYKISEDGEPSFKKPRLEIDNIPNSSDIKDFHEKISSGNLKEVKKFVNKFPEFKFCIFKAKCALQSAIESKNFGIYAFLKSQNFLAFDNKNFQELIEKLSEEEKRKILKENLKVLRSNPDDFINILATKIKLFAGGVELSFEELREMLEKLKEREENREVMKIAAQVDSTVVVDFVNSNLHSVAPHKDVSVRGTTKKNLIFLCKHFGKMHYYGTFAHELMHFVIKHVYENHALPYCKNDLERKLEWEEIVQNLKFQSEETGMDDILQRVFTEYSNNERQEDGNIPLPVTHAQKKEAAVRVNHLMAFYHDNDEKIVELEGLHPELFSYIRTKVLPDLKIPNVYRMIKLNNDFGLLQRTEDSELQVKPTDKSEILDLVTEDSKRVLIVTNVPQLMLSKIRNEIKNLPGNKLNLKARNIFVDAKVLEQKRVKEEFLNLIETTEVDRIITDSSSLKELLNGLKPEVQCFFVASEVDEELVSKFNFTVHEINIQWQELTEKTKKIIQKKPIKFQDLPTNLSKVLFNAKGLITPEILTILCSNNEIKVNCDSEVEKLEKFIDRTVQMKKKVKVSDDSMKQGLKFYEEQDDAEPQSHDFNPISQHAGASSDSKSKKVKFALNHEDFSLKNFIDKSQSDQILIISDVAGSGKTTLLTKIHEMLIQKFPFHFIIFISLLKYVDELTKGVGESFTEFMAKILNFNVVERKIFMQKYEKGEVKILFDAFDEISPKCKENTTKLLQNFNKNGKNQIFITTRTHLEHDLEVDLKVFAHRIKNLTKEEQVTFVVEYWENKDRDLVEKSAKKLVNKISKIISSNSNFIGVPLIVQGLAEAFKHKIDENFEREIENLDISSIYEKIVENFFSKFKAWCLKNNPKIIENMTMSPMQLHQYLAVCLLFNEEYANSLGLNHDEDEWPHEEIARCGLIKYDKDGKFHFNHLTNAEHFIAGFTFHLLKTVKKLLPVNLDFIFQVLREKKFQVVRMFLESKLNKVEKVEILKSFNSSREICEKVKNDKKFLRLCVSEKLFNIFEFFALTIKEGDLKLFKEVIELKDNVYAATNLMTILTYATNLTKFENFLNEILDFYSENIFDDFLLKVNEYNYFAGRCKNTQIFECFWNKIKVLFSDDVKLKSFLLMKGEDERNALLWSIAEQNENSFNFLFEQVFCKIFSFKEFAYESDESGENLLHLLARWGSVSMLTFALEKLKNEFSPEDLQNFIKLKNKNGQNLLHCAISNRDEKSVVFLVNFIKNEVGSEDLKKMLSELDNSKSLPLNCALKLNNLKVIKLFFSLYEQSFDKMRISQFLREKDKNGNNLLHHAASYSESKEVFEFLWMKIENLFKDKEELKEYLLVEGYNERNALLRSITKQNENTFYFLFEQVFCKIFSINEFAYEIDEYSENLLHCLARWGSVSMLKHFFNVAEKNFSLWQILDLLNAKDKDGEIFLHLVIRNTDSQENFEFVWSKIESLFKDKEQLKKYLLEKGQFEQNALMMSIFVRKETYFYFLFDIYCKLFNIKEFAYETDIDDENLLHFLAGFGSVSMLIFALNEVKKRYSHDDFQDLIKFKNEYGENLLNRAAWNKRCKNFEILLSFYEQNLNFGELKSLMCYRPSKFFNPEHAKREKMLDKYRESPETQFSNEEEIVIKILQ